jgi:hypothetical protein
MRETWEPLQYMQLTIVLEKKVHKKLIELKKFAKKLENIARGRMILYDGTAYNKSKFSPAESLAVLKPTPKQEKIESKMDIQYFCTVCSQSFDISEDEKVSILRSDDATKMDHPKHHGKVMEIMLIERD